MQTRTRATSPACAPALSWGDLTAHRADLVRYARRKLLDPALAEDLVHDVFEAALGGRAAYAGRSALKSWLIGILKHKIVDLVRQRAGHDPLPEDDGDALGPPLACPRPRPDEQAEQRQRLARALAGIRALPPALRAAMQLRVLEDRPTDEVCRRLAISADNLAVRIHRARRALSA